jgi:hypothetical protein
MSGCSPTLLGEIGILRWPVDTNLYRRDAIDDTGLFSRMRGVQVAAARSERSNVPSVDPA